MTKKDYLTLVPASPKVRKFARELGIDINKISGSERHGRITEKDIKLFKKENYTILLSPSAASFDQFKNFENRGTEFKKLCKFYAKKYI